MKNKLFGVLAICVLTFGSSDAMNANQVPQQAQGQAQQANVTLAEFRASIAAYEGLSGGANCNLRALLGTAENLFQDPFFRASVQAVVDAGDRALNDWVSAKQDLNAWRVCQDALTAAWDVAKRETGCKGRRMTSKALASKGLQLALREEADARTVSDQSYTQFDASKLAFDAARRDLDNLKNRQNADNDDLNEFLTQSGNFAKNFQLNNNNQ